MNQNDADRQANIDSEHLRLLSIFHFVSAGLGFMGVMFSSMYFILFRVVFSNPKLWEKSPQGPPPEIFLSLFKWFVLVFVVWFLVAAVGNLLSGIFMRKRIHRTFVMVMSAINCLHVPLGTILGIFTLIVLARGSVSKLFEPAQRL